MHILLLSLILTILLCFILLVLSSPSFYYPSSSPCSYVLSSFSQYPHSFIIPHPHHTPMFYPPSLIIPILLLSLTLTTLLRLISIILLSLILILLLRSIPPSSYYPSSHPAHILLPIFHFQLALISSLRPVLIFHPNSSSTVLATHSSLLPKSLQ